jgi:hypothetical protein
MGRGPDGGRRSGNMTDMAMTKGVSTGAPPPRTSGREIDGGTATAAVEPDASRWNDDHPP